MCNHEMRRFIDQKAEDELKLAAKKRRILNDFESIATYFAKDYISAYDYLIDGDSIKVVVETQDINDVKSAIKRHRNSLLITKNQILEGNRYLLTLDYVLEQ